MTIQAQRLTFIALNVSNLNESFSFYSTLLGLPIELSDHDSELNDPWYGGDHAAYSWTQGAYLHFAIYPAKEPNRPVTTNTQVGFHVFDFDAVHQRIIEARVTILEQPRVEPWGLTARYLDPDRNIVSITKNES